MRQRGSGSSSRSSAADAQQQTSTGINKRLLLWMQLRAVIGLLLALAGQLLLAWKLAVLLVRLSPWWPVTLLAAEAAFFVIWRAKKAALDEIPEEHVPEGHDGWACFERWYSSSHYNVKVLAIAEVRALQLVELVSCPGVLRLGY
jgi:hypothetical protein